MKIATLAVLMTALFLDASGAQAQHRGATGLTVTVGRHSTPGGKIDDRAFILLDVLVAGRVRTMSRWSIIAAGGVSYTPGPNMDICITQPDGTCARRPDFTVVNALAGVAKSVGRFSVRTLAGPALYSGSADRSLGLQGRLDLSSSASRHVGLGAMMRATFLPSHGGERLFPWAVGGSVTFR